MSRAGNGREGVLLMAYGGPHSLEEVGPYLRDVRGGRETPEELVREVQARYAAIGGGSPLTERSLEQAAALEQELARMTERRVPVAIGMRHWRPRIAQGLKELVESGVRRLVALCLAPHRSTWGTGAYRDALEEAVEARRERLEVRFIPHWGDHPDLIAALTSRAQEAMAVADGDGFDAATLPLILTAHSLPVSLLAEDEPYPRELHSTARELARRLRHPTWRLAYQSAGARPGRWLGPSLDEVLSDLAAAHAPAAVVVPIGFVSDHLETLYDLHIEARDTAARRGLRLYPAAAVNDHPALIAALADLVRG